LRRRGDSICQAGISTSLESDYKKFLKLTENEVAAAVLAVGASLANQRGDALLTPKQAAAQLGVSVDLIYELCASGRLRSRKIGRAVRIHPDDLRDLDEDSIAQ
jgi:excisionase family DNA binding protein